MGQEINSVLPVLLLLIFTLDQDIFLPESQDDEDHEEHDDEGEHQWPHLPACLCRGTCRAKLFIHSSYRPASSGFQCCLEFDKPAEGRCYSYRSLLLFFWGYAMVGTHCLNNFYLIPWQLLLLQLWKIFWVIFEDLLDSILVAVSSHFWSLLVWSFFSLSLLWMAF